MSDYNEWLDKQSESRGLSLKLAFEGGKKVGNSQGQWDMLEKVRNDLVQPGLDDKAPRNNGMIRAILDMHKDQLAKEADDE